VNVIRIYIIALISRGNPRRRLASYIARGKVKAISQGLMVIMTEELVKLYHKIHNDLSLK
jgi:hypothetical protein